MPGFSDAVTLAGLLLAATLSPAFGQAGADVPPQEDSQRAAPESERMLIATDSPGILAIVGFSEKQFVPRSGTMNCTVTGAEISQEIADVNVLINDVTADTESLQISRNSVRVDYTLEDGVNEVVVTALDTEGRLLRADRLIWAGDNELTVDVVNENYEPVHGAVIAVTLVDDKTARASATTTAGTARLHNLPGEDLYVEAQLGKSRGAATVAGTAGSVMIRLSTEPSAD